MDLVNGQRFLEACGLNLFAVLAVDELSESCREGLDRLDLGLHQYSSLVLMGSAGRQFWDQLQAKGMHSDHPIDDRSRDLAWKFARNYAGGAGAELIYPSSMPIPLIELGRLAGWSQPSQLGLGIHEKFGTWFAFRAVLLITANLPRTKLPAHFVSACLGCAEKPCVRQCPVGAVNAHDTFGLHNCIRYRQQENSRCQDRCLSRSVCPVGYEFQYSVPQMQYHARRSLASILKYNQNS